MACSRFTTQRMCETFRNEVNRVTVTVYKYIQYQFMKHRTGNLADVFFKSVSVMVIRTIRFLSDTLSLLSIYAMLWLRDTDRVPKWSQKLCDDFSTLGCCLLSITGYPHFFSVRNGAQSQRTAVFLYTHYQNHEHDQAANTIMALPSMNFTVMPVNFSRHRQQSHESITMRQVYSLAAESMNCTLPEFLFRNLSTWKLCQQRLPRS